MQGDYAYYELALTEDARPPCPSTTTNTTSLQPRTRFASSFFDLAPVGADRAAFLWIAGHHRLFVFWALLGELFDRITDAVATKDWDAAVTAFAQATVISRGDVAGLILACDFSTNLYQTVLRPGMAQAHPAFAAGMSPESQAMNDAAERMWAVLDNDNLAPPELIAATEAFKRSRHHWAAVHFREAGRLHPDDPEVLQRLASMEGTGLPHTHLTTFTRKDSFLQEQRRLEYPSGCPYAKREYERITCRNPQAMAAYDALFGVCRRPVSLLSYLRQFILVVDDTYHNLRDGCLTSDEFQDLVAADSLVIEILTARMSSYPAAQTH